MTLQLIVYIFSVQELEAEKKAERERLKKEGVIFIWIWEVNSMIHIFGANIEIVHS